MQVTGSITATTLSDATGRYQFAAAFPLAQRQATLNLSASYGNASTSDTLQIDLTSGAATTATHIADLNLTRAITLSGIVRNAFYADAVLRNADIALRLPDGNAWCVTRAANNGTFTCPPITLPASVLEQTP